MKTGDIEQSHVPGHGTSGKSLFGRTAEIKAKV